MTTSTINNLSGIIDIQQQELDNIGNFYYQNTPGVISQINTLNDSLNNNYTNIKVINGSVNNAISRQNDVLGIVNGETTRLAEKKKSVDNARDGQKRLMLLNDSYRKRYLQYMKIIIAVVIILAVFWVLKMAETYITIIPSIIFEFLIVLDIAIGIIYIYLVYRDIQNHDLIEYDKLIIQPPPDNSKSNNNTISKPGDDLLKSSKSCNDQNCCAEGTTWDEANAKCKPRLVTDPSGNKEPFVSDSPFESNSYNFI